MNANATILVVDDEEVVRRSHSRVLEGEHCQVEAVGDGEQALRAMETQPYDVVLLDLRMPGIDGMSLLKTLKATVAGQRSGRDHRISLGGHGQGSDTPRCLRLPRQAARPRGSD